MRFFKDSSKEHNYRARYWYGMMMSQRFYRLYPFAFIRSIVLTKHGVYHYSTLLRSNSELWKQLYKYIPSKYFFMNWQSVKVFYCSVLLFSLAYHIESRLWKERKFDKEPGQTIPLRNKLPYRLYYYLYEIKLKPVLYYMGIWIQKEDIVMDVNIEQIQMGRLYRRFLCLQYARKMGYSIYRNSSYDFLEISENYGRDY